MPHTTFHTKLTLHARHCLQEASTIARSGESAFVDIRHLLLAIFLEKGSLGSILLHSMGFEQASLEKVCLEGTYRGERKNIIPLSAELKNVLRRAFALASEFQYPYVGTEHFVYSLMEADSQTLDEIIIRLNIDEKKIESTLATHMNFDHLPSLGKILETPENLLNKNQSFQDQSDTPMLDQFTTDLSPGTESDMPLFIGRERELDRLLQILARKNKNNPLLIGEPGVGKTALVSALAERIHRGDVPHHLLGKRILSLDLALVVAGTNFRGEFENRIKEIIREASHNPEIILFVDEIHTLIGAGNTQGGLDAANILKPALARGELRLIGATTQSEYKRHIEKDAALERRFQMVRVDEPSPEEAKVILRGIKPEYQRFHGIAFPESLLDMAVDLSVRYLNDRFLPDKAIDIIDEAAALARHSLPTSAAAITRGDLERKLKDVKRRKDLCIKEERYEEASACFAEESKLQKKLALLTQQKSAEKSEDLPVLKIIHVQETVARMAGIPVSVLINDSPQDRIARLEKTLEHELIGQKEASDALIQSLKRSLVGMANPDKPIGSFLFLGPTGVGKTLTAKLLAKEFFGDQKALIRLDMSEFGERHTVAQMLGAPAGYVGYGEGGKLTEAVRKRPYSVILFDEIDKAHPDIWNVLLQILDEGQLTDAEGRTVNFKNTLIIMTSNQGTAAFTDTAKIGFDAKETKREIKKEFETLKEKVLSDLQKTIRPELLARIQNVIVYNPLSPQDILALTRLELKHFKKRLAQGGVQLTAEPAVIRHLAKESFSVREGARLVQKNIEKEVEKTVANLLLASPAESKLVLTLRDSQIVCQKK